jgi:hypothetical protein
MLAGRIGLGEEAGRLDHDVDTQIAPRQVAGLAIGQHLELLAVHADDSVAGVYVIRQLAHHRVVLEQVGESLGVGQVVDGDNLDVLVERVDRSPEVAANSAESVHSDAHSHVCQPSSRGSRR